MREYRGEANLRFRGFVTPPEALNRRETCFFCKPQVGPRLTLLRRRLQGVFGRSFHLMKRMLTHATTGEKEAMNTLTRTEPFTNIVVERDREALEVFGPSVQFLVAPQPSDEAPCVMRGTIPPGVSVPIHSHAGI